MREPLESHRRSVVKSLSYRVIAAAITTCIAWAITGNIKFGAAIGLTDTFVKILVYYFHERLWNRLSFGRKLTTTEQIAVSTEVEAQNKPYYLPSILEFLFRRWSRK